MEPLREIQFSFAPYRLAMGDVFRYVGPDVFVSHQFGFVRINAYTGRATTIVGVGYKNSAFPPSNIGLHIVGDFNQSVVELAANDSWIVVNNIPNRAKRDPADQNEASQSIAAVVWKNDGPLTYHGPVPRTSGVATRDVFWRNGRPRIGSGTLYIPDSDILGRWNAISLSGKAFSALGATPPLTNGMAGNIAGYTYRWIPLDGSGQQRYSLVRSDVASVPDSQPPATPAEGEPPMPVDFPGAPPLGPDDAVQKPPSGTPDSTSPPFVPPPVAQGGLLVFADRYEASVAFETTDGRKGKAGAVQLSPLFGYFFWPAPVGSQENAEVILKFADLSSINLPVTVFLPSATNVGFTLLVRDRQTGATKTHVNPVGHLACDVLEF